MTTRIPAAQAARPHPITLIPGDGIGPDVIAAAREVLDATGVPFAWDLRSAGRDAFDKTGTALPEATICSIREHGTALKGPLASSRDLYAPPSVGLREALGLYVGVRPCKAMGGVAVPFPATDVVLIRMLQGDLYAGIGFHPDHRESERIRDLVRESTGREVDADAGISLKPLSRSSAERVARAAFDYASAQGRRAVTAVHKASVMSETDGLFLDAVAEVAADYPHVEFGDALIDTACARLITDPAAYDVLVAPMMYGDILADVGAALIGGLGMAPGANFGDECAVFEPVHGTAPRHAGRGRANPIAAIMCGAMLLRHLGEERGAAAVEGAVRTVVASGKTLTFDLRRRRPGPEATTSDVTAAVVAALAAEREPTG